MGCFADLSEEKKNHIGAVPPPEELSGHGPTKIRAREIWSTATHVWGADEGCYPCVEKGIQCRLNDSRSSFCAYCISRGSKVNCDIAEREGVDLSKVKTKRRRPEQCDHSLFMRRTSADPIDTGRELSLLMERTMATVLRCKSSLALTRRRIGKSGRSVNYLVVELSEARHAIGADRKSGLVIHRHSLQTMRSCESRTPSQS